MLSSMTPITILDILNLRALEQPRSVAYTYLENGELEAESITYAELQKKAFDVAGSLQVHAQPSDRMVLIYPSGLAFLSAFFGCMYAQMIAVPLHSPRPGRHRDRLAAVIENSDARVVLTTSELAPRLEQTLREVAHGTSIQILATDDLIQNAPYHHSVDKIRTDDLAFLQYTSGSTSSPKGVMVSHRNLISNQEMIRKTFQGTQESTIVGWLPLYHDMGLIGNILQTLWIGARCILMSPTSFLQRPSCWLETISKYRATISGGPDFAYRLCSERLTDEQAAHLDLSSWKVAFNGSEPIRSSTIDRFAQRFEPHGFHRNAFVPCYGLAEATLFVAGNFAGELPVLFPYNAEQLRLNHACLDVMAGRDDLLVGSGTVAEGLKVRIVDPETSNPSGFGRVGEIWVAGPSVASGYWRNDLATQEAFHASLKDSNEDFLRTGDLGFCLSDELFVTGRLKDLIIIRGRNHYPQDIETTASACHPSVATSTGAAFAIEREVGTAVVLLQEVPRNVVSPEELTGISNAIRKAVGEQEGLTLEGLVLVRVGTIPRTTSGKVRRHACREAYLTGTLEDLNRPAIAPHPEQDGPISPQHDLSFRAFAMRELTAEIVNVEPEAIDATSSLLALGLDSLMMADLRFRFEAKLNLTVPLESMLLGKSISDLAEEAEQLTSMEDSGTTDQASDDSLESFRLSVGQRAIWFLYLLSPEDPAYNLFSVSRSKEPLDLLALREAFQILTDRHPLLRSIVVNLGKDPLFRTIAGHTIDFQIVEANEWSDEFLRDYLQDEANRPFRPLEIPPFRVQVLRQPIRGDVLLIAVHHLITDLASVSILLEELASTYSAIRLGRSFELPVRSHYGSFVRQQGSALTNGKWNHQRDYWLEYLRDANLTLSAPFDRSSKSIGGHGETFRFCIGEELLAKIRASAASLHVSLYALLLAGYESLLLRLTAQDDLLVGSVVSGRTNFDWSETVGYFVNQVVFRARWSAQASFKDVVAQTQRDVSKALVNQDYPFSTLTEDFHLRYGSRGEPLTRIMFSLQSTMKMPAQGVSSFALNHAGSAFHVGELALEAIGIENRGTQFDLSLVMAEATDSLAGAIQYNADLLSSKFVARLAAQFELLLDSVTRNPDYLMRELPIFSEVDRHRIVEEWNQTEIEYEPEIPVHELVQRRAVETPQAPAVRAQDGDLAYGDVAELSDLIAAFLRSKGINGGSVVGLHCHRSKYLPVAILGILKSGAAFLPLDPSLPEERIRYMLEQTSVPLVLTDEPNAWNRFPLKNPLDVVNVTTPLSVARKDRITSETPARNFVPHSLAYVIFTSGSTGDPKGVMVTHRNVVNFIRGMDQRFDFTAGDRFLALTSISFDISILEILWPLTHGGSVSLVPERGRRGSTLLSVALNTKGTEFSLFYFADASERRGPERYRLLLEGAKFADNNGFAAVWTPERHFHRFGGSYPNPSLTGAVIAAVTRRVGIRAGSVVLPLHDPIRVAEEWSTVDNLSGGRVGVAFASGWHVDDFALAPERYANRREFLLSGIDKVRRLWKGDSVEVLNGNNKAISVRLFPSPVQTSLPLWITASGTPATFQLAGFLGANLLTHLLGQTIEEVADNVRLYHQALEMNGYDPATRCVTLMLHTFIGKDVETVKKLVHLPFREYLRSSLGLVEKLIQSLALPVDLQSLSPQDLDDLLDFAFNRYWETSGLFGTVESCKPMVERITAIGVNEIACLIDFGVDTDLVLDSLPLLRDVMQANQTPIAPLMAVRSQTGHKPKTFLQCTPSMMKLLLAEDDDTLLRSVDVLLLGGEPLPVSVAAKLQDRFRFRIFNMYGPTETTIWSTLQEVTSLEGPLSIGRPIANTQCYILDDHGLLAAEGAIGELFIGGDGVAKGYWNRPDLTEERFIPNSFRAEAGARLYRTGDLARFLPDGRIELLGRTDHQVKVRGFRVELPEIEIALGSHPDIQDTVVMRTGGAGDDVRLIAFYVSSAGQTISPDSLRSLLRARLPEYMIPAEFVRMDSIPLMTNGKVDRTRLEAVQPAQRPKANGAIPHSDLPADRLESHVIEIWKTVLQLDQVGLDDNFFDLGGHSLLMVQVHSSLSERLGRQFPLVKLIENPTVRALAKSLSSEEVTAKDRRELPATERATLQRKGLEGLGRNATAARSVAS